MSLIDDPLLRRWAIDIVTDTELVSEARRRFLLDTHFPDAVLANLIADGDESDLANLFRRLPVERWEAHADVLVERWSGWGGTLAQTAAPLIARLRPVMSATLFDLFVTGVVAGSESDGTKLLGVLDGVRSLERDRSHRLLSKILPIVKESDAFENRAALVHSLVEAVIETAHPDRLEIVSWWLGNVATAGEDPWLNAVADLGAWLFGDGSLVPFVEDHILGITGGTLPSAGTLLRHDAPVAEINSVLRSLRSGEAKTASRWIGDRLRDFPVENAPAWWDDFVALVKMPLPSPTGRNVKRTWAEVFAFAGILTAYRLPQPDLSSAELDAIWGLVAADIAVPFGLETTIPRLRDAPRELVIERLIALARDGEETFVGVHAVVLMGSLGYDEFLPSLIDALDREFEEERDAADAALERYGDRAVVAVERDFDTLSDFQLLMVASLASRIGSDVAIEFFARHFARFAENDAYSAACVATEADAASMTEALDAVVAEGDPEIEWAWVVSAKLRGRIDTPRFQELAAKVERRKTDEEKRWKTFQEDGFLDGTPRLSLTCRACGRSDVYTVSNVWVTGDPADLQPFLAEEIPCGHCGAISQFDFPAETLEKLTWECERVTDCDAEMARMRERGSVLTIRAFEGPAGRRSAVELVREYEAYLVADPNDAARHRSFGNLLLDVGRDGTAESHFRRCREIDPAYLEAHLGLAQVADRRGETSLAADILLEGAKFAGAMACRRPEAWESPSDFVADYIALYNAVTAGDSTRPKLSPTAFKTKLGRNDPCPLGTGKKVKKCCGGGN